MQDCTEVHPSPGTGATEKDYWNYFFCNRHVVLPPWIGQMQRQVPGYIPGYIPACLVGKDVNRLMVNVINQYQTKAPFTVPRAGGCSKQHNNYV